LSDPSISLGDTCIYKQDGSSAENELLQESGMLVYIRKTDDRLETQITGEGPLVSVQNPRFMLRSVKAGVGSVFVEMTPGIKLD